MTTSELQNALRREGYIASDALAMAIDLALALGRPLLLEGAAGVGKTEVARALSATQGTEFIRLQCYEGLDAAQAIYEWNYPQRLLEIQARQYRGIDSDSVTDDIFKEQFLLKRQNGLRNKCCYKTC